MATTRLVLQRGQEAHQATVSTTTGTVAHVQIDFDKGGLSRDEALIEIEKIKKIVMERDWPILTHARL